MSRPGPGWNQEPGTSRVSIYVPIDVAESRMGMKIQCEVVGPGVGLWQFIIMLTNPLILFPMRGWVSASPFESMLTVIILNNICNRCDAM